jgi:hypothetical protein
MTSPKQAHTLSTYFGKKFKEKYGFEHKFNRNKARWSWDNILMDMTLSETQDLIDYYFGTINPSGHTLEWFFYNYDKLAEAKEKTDADRKALAILREQSKQRAEEWRAKRDNN